MKTINVSFEDSEMEAITKAKGKQSWREFIMKCAKAKKERKNNVDSI